MGWMTELMVEQLREFWDRTAPLLKRRMLVLYAFRIHLPKQVKTHNPNRDLVTYQET